MPTETVPTLTCDADLERAVGNRPAGAMLKSIRYLDDHAEAVLARAPLVALTTFGPDGHPSTRALGGEPGFASASTPERLDVGAAPLAAEADGAPAGLLALVPGYGETLRVNGHVRLDPAPHIEVQEVYLHCAKAIIRSGLWEPPPAAPIATTASGVLGWPDDVAAFLARAPFVLLASADGAGHADVSPKGDPPGLVQVLPGGRIALADRPGNRRTDTLHNLMANPALGLLALVPGDDRVVEVRGTAVVSDDHELRASMAVRDRTPKVAIVIDVDHAELRAEPGITAARLWDTTRHVPDGTLPSAGTIWADHVKRNDDPGLGAKVARRLINRRALDAGVGSDYKRNLY